MASVWDLNPLRFGWAGVDLFFVISGFLITGILLSSKEDPGYFKKFYSRRFLRIFPLYYLFLITLFLIYPLFAQPSTEWVELKQNQAYYWLYGVNFYIAKINNWLPFGTSHLWSLSVEEQFYLLWPFVVMFVPGSKLTRFCIFLILVTNLSRVFVMIQNWHGSLFVCTSLLTRMDCLVGGALLAIGVREKKNTDLFSWPVLALCLAAWAIVFIVEKMICFTSPLAQLIGFPANCYAATMFVSWAIQDKNQKKVSILNWPVLRLAGKYCYSLYLFHLPMLGLTKWLLRHAKYWVALYEPVEVLLSSVVWVGFCFLLSYVLWRYLESPLIQLKKYFEYQNSNNMPHR